MDSGKEVARTFKNIILALFWRDKGKSLTFLLTVATAGKIKPWSSTYKENDQILWYHSVMVDY